jgi:hypothetical protein
MQNVGVAMNKSLTTAAPGTNIKESKIFQSIIITIICLVLIQD